MLVLNFLCEKNIPFYHASWIQILQYFQYSFFQEKKLNHSEGQVIFQIDGHHLQKISFISFFIVAFCKIFIKLRCSSNPFETIYR